MNPKEKQATPQVAFVFLGSFMNEPPAIAGSRAHKRVSLSIGEKPACIIAWA